MGKAEEKINLKKSISQAVEYLKDHFEIDQVILFGSQVSGEAKGFSDIDLAVISPDFKGKCYEDILKVFCDLALKYGPSVELRPYSTEEVRSARPTNFLGYILKTGKIVYKNGKFLI